MNQSQRWNRSKSRSCGASLLCSALIAAIVGSFGCDQGDDEVRVVSVSPRAGHLTGESPVAIGGKNFRTDIGYTVYFGTQSASRVMVQDPETLVAIAPGTREAGEVDLTIRGDDGTALRIRNAYRYENMGGSVVQQLGGDQQQRTEGSNLAY